MFDPVQFFYIARKLYQESTDNDSGTARTCISRAYYAAFLVARDNAGIAGAQDVHKRTIQHYKTKKSIIGSRLDNLRTLRTDSDYILNATITKRDSGNALRLATEILKELGKDIIEWKSVNSQNTTSEDT
jgi:uncharacterized protein (UPF0332 family)